MIFRASVGTGVFLIRFPVSDEFLLYDNDRMGDLKTGSGYLKKILALETFP
jgi:hypothetical protein